METNALYIDIVLGNLKNSSDLMFSTVFSVFDDFELQFYSAKLSRRKSLITSIALDTFMQDDQIKALAKFV